MHNEDFRERWNKGNHFPDSMLMKNKLHLYITEDHLFTGKNKILLAVSGGVDSILLAHLFNANGYNFGMAHCNFKLRGKEADEDEQFVKNLANQFRVPFYSVTFDTEKIARQRKQSIQLTARELRYEWLENIRQKEYYDYIATAHHHDDSIETIIHNFIKGTGIRGVRGILPKQKKIIRPLLFATKSDIIQFVKTNNIDFREDASNQSDKYTRNYIRQHIVSEMQKLNPGLPDSMKTTIRNLRETEQLFLWAIDQIKNQIVTKEGDKLIINRELLDSFPAQQSILFEIITPFGFNNDQSEQILALPSDSSGQQFYSPTHQLLVNRNQLIIHDKTSDAPGVFLIPQGMQILQMDNYQLIFKRQQSIPDFSKTNPFIAYFDEETLTFPLRLRKWKTGDFFYPIGMNGKRQKLKDFFINNKFSLIEKEQTWLLESNGAICWIVGHRMDEQFKITSETKRVVCVEWKVQG